DGSVAANTLQSAYGVDPSWGLFSSTIGATAIGNILPNAPAGGEPLNGYSSSVAFDSAGRAYYGYVDDQNAANGYVQISPSLITLHSSDNGGAGIYSIGASTTQVELVNDGVGVTALSVTHVTPPYTGNAVRAAWSLDKFATPTTLSSGDVKSMSA